MKTKILSIMAILGLVLVMAGSGKAESLRGTASALSTVLPDISNFSKIEARGNVEVYLTSGDVNRVKVYSNYYSENALVQNDNGVLRITSYKPEKLVVWVIVKDLREVALYDNAVVNSFGKLGALELNVNLHDNALANLKLDAISADITINDRAMANLTGTADDCRLTYNQSATVNSAKFASNHISRNVISTCNVSKNTSQQYAGL